jgi:putative glutamine amidotransferase
MKPLIGITASHSDRKTQLNDAYVQAVRRAGGVPLALPALLGADPASLDAALGPLLDRLDGVLLSGGPDVDPACYGGAPHQAVYGVDAARDCLEIALAQAVAQNGKPFLAICRGVQVLNVALGGTLYTHIPDQLAGALYHNRDTATPRDLETHVVELTAASRLAQVLGTTRTGTNSFHHQGILACAPSLSPVAFTSDGLTEGVELPGHPFGLGVQWHPEEMSDDPAMQSLFAAFVSAAGKPDA